MRRWRNGVRVLIVWTWTRTRIAIGMMWRRRLLVKGRTSPCLRIGTMAAHENLDTSTGLLESPTTQFIYAHLEEKKIINKLTTKKSTQRYV